MLMTDDRIAGTVRNIGGKVQEGVGKVTGDTKSEAKGVMNQAMEGAQTVKEATIQGHDIVRKFVENNPHTATAIALGIGLFIGYAAHRQPQRRRYWWD
jgi:uncharacterized protein YjbJ (UPF0337 family)